MEDKLTIKMEDKLKFKYTVIPKAEYDTMLTMENGFIDKGYSNAGRYAYKGVCVDEETLPRAEFENWPPAQQYITRWVYSTAKLEVGKEYDLIIFPKTCSRGFAFVKQSVESKE
jgi:hypothetical protein